MIGLIIRLSTYKSEMSSSALDQKKRTEVGIPIKSVKKMSLLKSWEMSQTHRTMDHEY